MMMMMVMRRRHSQTDKWTKKELSRKDTRWGLQWNLAIRNCFLLRKFLLKFVLRFKRQLDWSFIVVFLGFFWSGFTVSFLTIDRGQSLTIFVSPVVVLVVRGNDCHILIQDTLRPKETPDDSIKWHRTTYTRSQKRRSDIQKNCRGRGLVSSFRGISLAGAFVREEEGEVSHSINKSRAGRYGE